MKKYLPSKKFQRILLICGILAIVIFSFSFITKKIQYSSEIKKLKNLEVDTSNETTVNELVAKDTDGDGVPDWQEALWGTDINKVATFNDINDDKYIENKKKAMGVKTEDAVTTANLTETEKFSRQFLASMAALKVSGQINDQDIKNFATKIGENIADPNLIDSYTIKDIKSDPKIKNKIFYYNDNVKKIYDSYLDAGIGSELDVVNDALVTYTTSKGGNSTDQLTEIGNAYMSYAEKLAKIPVPVGLEQNVLNIVNTANNTGISVLGMSKIIDDPVVGLTAISQYQKYNEEFNTAITTLKDAVSQ